MRSGADLIEIHAPVWRNIEDKSQLRGYLPSLRILIRWLCAYPRLVVMLFRVRKPDLLLVGYPGIIDVFVACIVCQLRGIPVVWDVFLSLYDTIVDDRKLIRKDSLLAKGLYFIERLALRLPALIFMDSQANARRIESLFSLPQNCCGAVWVGVEKEHFSPEARQRQTIYRSPSILQVLFYGQFIPLHGVITIIEAARQLSDASVHWTLIGRGQEAPMIRDVLTADPVPYLRWIEWVDYETIGSWISEADLCLGIFGTSEKAASVIPNKIFQILAVGKPLVTRDSPAIRELLEPLPSGVYLIPPADPTALVKAVLAHFRAQTSRGQIACYGDIATRIDALAIGAQFLNMVRDRLGQTCYPSHTATPF